MKIRIFPTSTGAIVAGIKAQVWQGYTSEGLRVHAFLQSFEPASYTADTELTLLSTELVAKHPVVAVRAYEGTTATGRPAFARVVVVACEDGQDKEEYELFLRQLGEHTPASAALRAWMGDDIETTEVPTIRAVAHTGPITDEPITLNVRPIA